MTNTELLEKQDLREELIGRIDVLDKVKRLILIPELEVMTFEQMGEYFETSIETIKSCYKYNQHEIDADGVTLKTQSILKVDFQPLEISQGMTVFQISDGFTLRVPNRGIKVFPKRAILRIAMLLRDSEIAKEIRTQLLNTFEHSTNEQRTAEIDKEQEIYLAYARAALDGDKEAVLLAAKDAFDYKNRHIAKLQESNAELSENNKALAGEILKWEERSCLNKAVRVIASIRQTQFQFVWKELYDELMYKHHIGLSLRGDRPYIQHIREDEWGKVQQSLAAICENAGISTSKVLEKAKVVQKQ